MSGVAWSEIVEAAAEQMIAAVRSVRETHPDEHVYGAMFHEFYGDGSMIAWPTVTVGTEESLASVMADAGESADSSLRWSGPDLVHTFDPGAAEDALADAVQARASSRGDVATWETTYDRFVRSFPKAAKLARKRLVAEKLVGADFIAIASDESAELVPLSLTAAQVRKHFPQYDAAEQERRRLAALPVAERVAELLPEAVTPRYQGPLVGEHAALLVACGTEATAALARVVRGEEYARGDVTAARLLAEINIDTPEVIDALEGLMLRTSANMNARAWAASALARMDRADLVLARVPQLPVEVVARGISAPLRGFRDHGAHRKLDYAPLETLLRWHPELEEALTEELKPGVGFCTLETSEIPVAEAARDSEWQVVRTHARTVLKNAQGKL